MEDKKEIFIQPEGWTDYLFIEPYSSRCGSETNGLSIGVVKSTKDTRYGGVIKREDMRAIVDLFDVHLKEFPLPIKEVK